MTARIFNLFLAAASGAIGVLMLADCTSSDIGGSSAAVGVGVACTVDSDCATGLECEHASCQPHPQAGNAGVADDNDDQGEDQGDDNGAAGDDNNEHDAGTAQKCTLTTDCPTGQKCDDGVCKIDDSGSGSGGDDGGGSGGDGSDG